MRLVLSSHTSALSRDIKLWKKPVWRRFQKCQHRFAEKQTRRSTNLERIPTNLDAFPFNPRMQLLEHESRRSRKAR
jgi:hypothetical protein